MPPARLFSSFSEAQTSPCPALRSRHVHRHNAAPALSGPEAELISRKSPAAPKYALREVSKSAARAEATLATAPNPTFRGIFEHPCDEQPTDTQETPPCPHAAATPPLPGSVPAWGAFSFPGQLCQAGGITGARGPRPT